MVRYSATFFISTLLGLFLIFSLPGQSIAKRGCCSDHGGVAGCNQSTGFQLCKDGTTSPSCKCEGTTTTKSTKKSNDQSSGGIIPTLFGSSAAKKSTESTSATTATTTKSSTVGCCSGHGGVGKCDKKAGYYKCKDGTLSSTCTCAKETKAKKAKETKKSKEPKKSKKTKAAETTVTQ